MNQHSIQTLAAFLALASQKDCPTNETLVLSLPPKPMDPASECSMAWDLARITEPNPRGRYLGPPNPQGYAKKLAQKKKHKKAVARLHKMERRRK